MLYAPKKGKEARLENIRDLKPTFPWGYKAKLPPG